MRGERTKNLRTETMDGTERKKCVCNDSQEKKRDILCFFLSYPHSKPMHTYIHVMSLSNDINMYMFWSYKYNEANQLSIFYYILT